MSEWYERRWKSLGEPAPWAIGPVAERFRYLMEPRETPLSSEPTDEPPLEDDEDDEQPTGPHGEAACDYRLHGIPDGCARCGTARTSGSGTGA